MRKKIAVNLLSLLVLGGCLYASPAPAAYSKCRAHHKADGKKLSPSSKTLITGLTKDKLLADLKGYKAGTTNNGENAKIMYNKIKNVSNTDIAAIGSFCQNCQNNSLIL